jgi:glycosyltransferase involved in cell wall biosynthesis
MEDSDMRLVFFMRRPRHGANFSVENIVSSTIACLSPDIEAVRAVSRFESNGVFRRLYNVIEAASRQGDVNHVTGDVHFLTYLLRKKTTLLTVLDCSTIVGTPSWRKRIIKLLWFTIPTRQCAMITVISQTVKEDLLKHVRVSPEKIHVVPVAVPSTYVHVPRVFNAERPVVLQVGTAINKNLPRLFEALAGIPCRLRIVGNLSDEQRGLLERFQLDYENYVGLSNERMFALYCEADIVAFASTFEGFGMPIIEANLVGRPVVAGNVASMPEVAGEAACLVDPFDVSSIRQGLLRVIEDATYRDGLVRKGFENARRFDRKTIARQFEDLYRQLDAARPQGARNQNTVQGVRVR